MKIKLLFFLLCGGLLLASCNESDESAETGAPETETSGNPQDPEMTQNGIPEAVSKSFSAEYANAEDVEWEQEGDYFEAEFEWNGTEMEAVYDASGKKVGSETVITLSELPQAAQEYLAANHSGMTPVEIEREEMNGKVSFEVEFESEGSEIEIVFDAEGQKISSEEEETEDDGDEQDDE